MRTVKIESLDDLDVLMNVTRKMFDDNGSLQATVKQLEESLSDKQRGLYWRWVTVFSAENGDTKVDFHNQYKENVFLPIYLADPENHPKLCAAVSAMRSIRHQISEREYLAIREHIMDELSHLKATVANMRDVLRQLETDAMGMGIILPPPPGPGLLREDSEFCR